MPRIPEEDLERLKREIPVQRLAEARGIDLKRHGTDLLGLVVVLEADLPEGLQDLASPIADSVGLADKGHDEIPRHRFVQQNPRGGNRAMKQSFQKRHR